MYVEVFKFGFKEALLGFVGKYPESFVNDKLDILTIVSNPSRNLTWLGFKYKYNAKTKDGCWSEETIELEGVLI